MPIANVRAALSAGPKLHPFTAAQLSDSPLSLFKMDETSGTVMADSGSVGNNGSYATSDPPTLGTRSVFGLVAPDFLGQNAEFSDSAALAAYHSGPSGVCTIEFLLRCDTITHADYMLTTDVDLQQFNIAVIGPNGQTFAHVYTTGVSHIMNVTSQSLKVLVDTDYHFVLTYDRAAPRFELWLNGVSVAVDTTANTGNTGQTTRKYEVGARSSGSTGGIDGAMCSLAIYPTVLTSTQIADHYAALG